MKKKHLYEFLVAISVAIFFVCAILRVGEILRENSENGGQSTSNISSRETLPQSSNDDQGKVILRLYGSTIREYSKRYDLDWRLVLAVMRQESRFSIDAESQCGAVGLMQIMPTTFEDIAERMGLEDIMNPRSNIAAGIKHLSLLSDSFEDATQENRTRLTLAAYNAGLGRIIDAQHLAVFLNDNPNTWEGVRDAFPLLSKRFTTLHERAWEGNKPHNGYFKNYRQTVEYVDRVMTYYEDYRQKYQ